MSSTTPEDSPLPSILTFLAGFVALLILASILIPLLYEKNHYHSSTFDLSGFAFLIHFLVLSPFYLGIQSLSLLLLKMRVSDIAMACLYSLLISVPLSLLLVCFVWGLAGWGYNAAEQDAAANP